DGPEDVVVGDNRRGRRRLAPCGRAEQERADNCDPDGDERQLARARSHREASCAPGCRGASANPSTRRSPRAIVFQMEGFGGLFGDPEELQKRMAEFAEQMQAQQGLVWADNAIKLAVEMTGAAIN